MTNLCLNANLCLPSGGYPIVAILLALLLFPGVIAHELAHQFFCWVFRVPVLRVCYFRFGNPAGYVMHQQPRKAAHHILIGIGPFLFNTTLAFLLALARNLPLTDWHTHATIGYLLLWLSVAIGTYAFPSTGDARSIWRTTWRRGSPLLARVAAVPVVGLIYLGALGSRYWLDLAHALAVTFLLPHLLITALVRS